MGNSWRFETPVPNGPINNSFSRRYRSSDRRDRTFERRRSNSVKRGREPIRRMWARKNSVEGQHANRSSRAAVQHTTEVDDADAREYHSDGPITLR
ncbi:hypothetical protein HPP92_022870 [Vanilla planifolia]|uniref:Uncharacterized protein n=1 Tax=Vanilla planifolia TaxID=51239 RepID=A0A835PUY1_VANPL|nr:hypothetical protein HPP92_022870 [Vanilla planifolia]